jgi:glutamate/tyrosine decarboxylase-like PLP-dependent enzyme
VGASLDLGDNSFTCGRRSDAVKLWAMWKYYGTHGLGMMVESRVDFLSKFALAIQSHEAFILACEPWPLNVNFFYVPKRFRPLLRIHGIDTSSRNPTIPDEISSELGHVSVKLKLRLQQSGEIFMPYQPLSNQQGECFRLVIAGNKSLDENDITKIMNLMDHYGLDL